MDKLTQLTNEYNAWADLKESHKGGIKLCDRQMDKLKKEISEESKK